MAPIRIIREQDVRSAVEAAFGAHRAELLRLIPSGEIEHVGSTSVPGALTKGDLDVLVRVTSERFSTAVDALRRRYRVHQPENWTPSYASFVDADATSPPVGVQLVVAGSRDDRLFGPFREALIGDPALLAAYNELKRRLDGCDYEQYTDVKGEFVEAVLRDL
jgi:GrpB-like predicted nucleotidyltransferase (UPF0157 family)